MTETLQHEAAAPAPPQDTHRPLRPVLVGARAAVVAAVVGLLAVALPVLLLRAGDPRAGGAVADALRGAGQVWLVLHGGALEVPTGRVTLTPLGLLLLPLLLLARAGRSVSRRLSATSGGAAARAGLLVAAPYTAVVGAVALASATSEVQPDGLSAVLHAAAVALLGATAGALRHDRLWRTAWMRFAAPVRHLVPAAVAAGAVLAAAGALLAGVSLAVHLSRAAELAAATSPGPVGGAGLLATGVALVPNAVVWAVAWLAGPGFAVGLGTGVGPFAHELGAVPALPLLAALPASGISPWLGASALLVPVGAGAVAGHLLHGSATCAPSRVRAVGDALVVGTSCGALWAALAWLSAGAAGGLRMVDLGPSPWRVGLAVAAEVAVGALVTRLALARRT